MEGDTQDVHELVRVLTLSPSVTLLKLYAEDTDARRCLSVQHLLTYFVAKVNTVKRYIVMATIYAPCYAPTYFRKTQDTGIDSTLLFTLEVARNCCNFCCTRSRVAILLALLIFIHLQGRQTKGTLLTSMHCSSVVKAFFVPKRGTEIDEDVLCQNLYNTHMNNRPGLSAM